MYSVFGLIEGLFSPTHLLIFLAIGILLFGKRLPEVGRSLGKGIVEFKKGLKGLEDDVSDSNSSPHTEHRAAIEPPRPPQRLPTTAPKFEETTPPVQPPPQA
jgi:sec-independent protein translocase protein TatA